MVYPISKRIILSAFGLWIREVNGLENVPVKGPFIVSANHASYMDHMFLGKIIIPNLNQKLHFLAKKEHFDNFIERAWHRYGGAIPVDRESGGKKGLKIAIKSLNEGKIIGIYPEGTRTLTGKIQRARTGVARLALMSKVPVLPVGIMGTFEILPKGKYIPKLKKGTVNIGKPIYFEKYYDEPITKKLLRELTTKIMKEIAKLSNQKYEFD